MIFYLFLLLIIIFGWEIVVVVAAYLTIKIGTFLLILGLVLSPYFIYEMYEEHQDKIKRGGFKTAEEMRIDGEIASQKAIAEFKVWQEWDSKLTKSQRDSIKRSLDKSYEDSNPKCPKCHREFKYVWSDPQDYIDGVGRVCTHCYIEYYKKHKK